MQSHLTFVTMILGVATAFRLWDQAQTGRRAEASDHQIAKAIHKVIDAQTGEITQTTAARPSTHLASRMEEIYTPPAKPTLPSWSHEQLEGQGPLRWRRRLRRENLDKVIVFVGHQYGIFYASEMLVLSGVLVRNLPSQLGTHDDLLRRYGC